MPTYDYKCTECGKMFEVFRYFSELDEQVNCPNCGIEKIERVFSIPHIEGEIVAGFGYRETESPPINPEPSSGMGRGMGRRPRDGGGRGKRWGIR